MSHITKHDKKHTHMDMKTYRKGKQAKYMEQHAIIHKPP